MWEKFSEVLPPKDGTYLISAPSADPEKPLIAIAYWNTDAQRFELLPKVWCDAITHWRKPPDPPES